MTIMETQKEPWMIMLVGVPGSGKSTWIKNLKEDMSKYAGMDFVVISTDDYIDKKAEQEGKTYTEVFKKYIDEATAVMEQELKGAFVSGRNVIWDQTNLTCKTRAKKLAKVPVTYKKMAIAFCTSDEELERRLKDRAEKTGKFISPEIVNSMKSQLELPSKDEGFDDVMRVMS